MKSLFTTVFALCALPGFAAAQSIGEPIPGRGPAKSKPAAARPAPAATARPCPEYGPGFVRLEGSSACVRVGGGAPVVVQSMTNTDTADVAGTVAQVAALARQGSELVRITVDRDEAAAAVPHIRERLDILGIDVPLIGRIVRGHRLFGLARIAGLAGE